MTEMIIIGCVAHDRFVLCKFCLHELNDTGCIEFHKKHNTCRHVENYQNNKPKE